MMLVKLGLAEGPSPETIVAYDQEVARQLQQEEDEAKALIRDTSDSPESTSRSSGSEGDSSSAGEMAVETDQDVLSLPSAGALAKHLGLWMPTRLSQKTELALKRAVVSCLDLLEESTAATAAVVASGGATTPVPTATATAGSLGQGVFNQHSLLIHAVINPSYEFILSMHRIDCLSSFPTLYCLPFIDLTNSLYHLPFVCIIVFVVTLGMRLEVEDIVARAADSAPVKEFGIKLLRTAINGATAEFEGKVTD